MPHKDTLNRSDAWLILNAIPHIGPVNTRRLLEAFDSDPIRILKTDQRALCQVKGIGERAALSIANWNDSFDLEGERRKMTASGVSFIDADDSDYPDALKTLYDPPLGLYARGDRSLARMPRKIAIVGSRRSTLYGLQCARTFAQRLAAAGVCIVSGMARGIDSAAHEGAIEVGGSTIAVLGNGIDVIYPPKISSSTEKYPEVGSS
jgi:DNA processing protein